MNNPSPAFRGTICDQCSEEIEEGDDVYFDDGKFCVDCAEENGNVCDCGNFKKDDFKTCYECSKS